MAKRKRSAVALTPIADDSIPHPPVLKTASTPPLPPNATAPKPEADKPSARSRQRDHEFRSQSRNAGWWGRVKGVA